MIITFWKGVFVADHKSGEEQLLKKAGFAMHEPTLCESPAECRGCRAHIGRRFFTSRIEHATRLRRFCNQRALTVMKEHLQKLAKSRAVESSIVVPARPGLEYKPFQKAGIAYAVQRKDTLIADEPGLGKTIQALGFINHVQPSSVLIVCPATLILNWKAEAKKWLVGNYSIYIPKSGEDAIPDPNPGEKIIAIVTFEKTVGRKNGDGRVDTPLSRSLRRSWDVEIFDEAHALKNPDAIRTQVILGEGGLYEQSRRSLFLTGTPMENRPIEIWPIAAALCPARFGEWWDFARRYCGLHEEQHGKKKVWVANGSTNASELQQRLRTSIMVRRLKADVLKELPPKRRQVIALPDSDVDWSRYPEVLRWKEAHQAKFDEGMARLEAARTTAEYLAAVKELDKITVPFTETSDVRHKSALLKLPACLKLADELLASLDCMVIFAHHRDVLEAIHAHYGEKSCVIYGDTPQKNRIPIVDAFQRGSYKVFIGGLKAAGTGITLTRASTAIFFETDWNPSVVRQAEDRLSRLGQRFMTHIIQPVLNNSLDANMIKMTVAKQATIDRILDEMPEDMRATNWGTIKRAEE